MEEKAKLTTGQRLWYKNKDTDLVGYVIVKRVYDEFFIYQLEEKEHRGNYEWIGTRLYYSLFDIPLSEKITEKARKAARKKLPLPKLKYKTGYNFRVTEMERPLVNRANHSKNSQSEPYNGEVHETFVERTPSCDICALRKNGTCGSLSNQLCEDYRPTQYISKEEMESFPEFGDATAFRLNKWRR